MNQGYVHREAVAPEHAGRTLLEHLVRRWRHGTEAAWAGRLARGEVALGGARASGRERLAAGQEVVWRRPPWEEPRVPLSFALLARTDALLAVAKPAGMPTMPSGGRFLEHTLLARVRRRWPDASPLHRLDRGTSGIVLFARTRDARRVLSTAWQRGLVRRLYRGLVAGVVRDDELLLDAPIGERPHPRLGRVFTVAADGRPARTHARVLERREDATLLEIEIATGRPHQIRIHLAWAGHPLVGEPFFGAGGAPREDRAALPGDPGYLLHAERIVLPGSLLQGATAELPHEAGPQRPCTDFWCSPPSELRARGAAGLEPRGAARPSRRSWDDRGTGSAS